MYEEVFEGMNYSNHEIAQMFSKTFEDDLSVKDHKDMVIVKILISLVIVSIIWH